METRLLDAARHLFLSRGFDGTSCDQVVALAQAGKASLYARYANKEALFAAVVDREVNRSFEPDSEAALDLPLQDRLLKVGTSIIEHALQPEAVALMRLIIAEAGRFPEFASRAGATWRAREVQRVAEVIAQGSLQEVELHRSRPLAEAFIDLVSVPSQMRALLGEDLEVLRRDAVMQIEAKIAVLDTAGWLDVGD